MLALRESSPETSEFNHKWGCPNGRTIPGAGTRVGKLLVRRFPRVVGPFQYQLNNDTREREYAWAFQQITSLQPSRALDVGGGLCGMQFVLERSGVHVVNVDPGEDSTGLGWPVHTAAIERINRAFKTKVELVSATVQDAGLEPDSFDVAYSISTIEHIDAAELPTLLSSVREALKPGGSLVLTIDLFLDVEPFTRRTANRYGYNVDVRSLVRDAGMDLVVGDRSELFGFDEFSHLAIQENLERYFVGRLYPCMAQLLVLRKPDNAG
jgi:SAM-dependent methyltransferase